MQFNQASSFGQRNNPRFTVAYNVPDRQPTGETVNKIFMRVAGGKYFDIKKAIIQERSSLGLSDTTGRTIMHYILLNEELSKGDKYDLIKQVSEQGAPTDNPDNAGIRPLHLAAGQQNRKVVKFLLGKKAEVNGKDTNHMTPLHYAVLPETTTCPAKPKKILIPDQETTTDEFRTDDFFDKMFTAFKSDPKVQMYMSHLASVFKNRYVYGDQAEDKKAFAKLVKDVMGERSGISVTESIGTKLVDYKKSIYTKTKTDFGKTFSKVDIKEGTTNGWGPTYQGTKINQHAVLPFPNLRFEFNTLFDAFMKANISTGGNLLAQVAKVRKYVGDARKYVLDTNAIMYPMYDCYNVINTYRQELVSIEPKAQTLHNALHILLDGCYAPHGIPNPDFNSNNSSDVLSNVSTELFTQAHANPFNVRPFQREIRTGTFVPWVGLGHILMHYVDYIETTLNLVDRDIQDITNMMNRGLALDSQIDIVLKIGNTQIRLVNICYALMLVEAYAKHLSAILEKFKTSLVDNDTFQTLENISGFINEVYDNHYSIDRSNLRIATYHSLSMPEWTTHHQMPVIYTHAKNGLHAYSYVTNTMAPKQIWISKTNPTPKPLIDGEYVVNISNNNVTGIISSYTENISRGDLTNIVDRLNKIVEAGGLGRDGKITDSHRISNIYSSIYDLQDKINGLINVYNTMNGYLFINTFNNKLKDDSYNDSNTDVYDPMMLTKMQKLKTIPDTYKKFYDTINPILRKNNKYSSANAQETIIRLVKTYGYDLSATDKMFLVRGSKQPLLTGKVTGNNLQISGIMTNIFSPSAGLLKGSQKVEQGYPRVYVGNLQNQKADDLTEEQTIINTVVDSHVYLIKIILIMYYIQYMANIYETGIGGTLSVPTDVALYKAMNQLMDQIDQMTNKNSLGILFGIIGKMIDEIVISTLDSMSQISASNYLLFLAKDTKITSRPTISSLLGAVIPMDIRQLVTKPDERTRTKDAAILSSVVVNGVGTMGSNPRDRDIMQFFIRDTEQDTEQDTEFNRLIDFDSVERNTDVCYQIDEDVISDLLDGGADPNACERSGETPLSLAVFLQNEKIVDTLLRGKAKVTFRSPSGFEEGKNIYNICFKQLLESINTSPYMNVDEIDKRAESHIIKKSGMRKTFSNSKSIMRMVSYLFMHQLTSIAKSYPNMWSRDKHSKILSMLNLETAKQSLIPLATMDPSLIDETISGYATFRDTMNGLANKLIKEREIYIRLDNSVKNLTLEQRELGPDDAFRRAEINQMITELNQEISQIQQTIQKTMDQINTLQGAKTTGSNAALALATKQQIQASNTMFSLIGAASSRDVCNVYDIFFKRIISTGMDVTNSEYTTYIQSWTVLLNRPDEEYEKDHTQMIGLLQKYVSKNGIVEPDIFIDAYEPINDLYDTVLYRYGRDYSELIPYLSKDGESQYDQNYVLKQIYCIMFHVFKHTMSINFINTIAQLLARRDKGRTESTIMRNIYQAMKSSEFIKYCIETVPRQVIKTTCKIASSEKDPDQSLSVTDVLNRALDKLTISTFDSIDKSSIELAKEIVVPFFVTYMETYTAEMHMFMVKQLKMMMVQGRWLCILKLLAKKAVLESA